MLAAVDTATHPYIIWWVTGCLRRARYGHPTGMSLNTFIRSLKPRSNSVRRHTQWRCNQARWFLRHNCPI